MGGGREGGAREGGNYHSLPYASRASSPDKRAVNAKQRQLAQQYRTDCTPISGALVRRYG